MTTIEKVCAAFPELDMVNHMNRAKLSEMMQTEGLVRDENFRPIDGKRMKNLLLFFLNSNLWFPLAIVLLGEPVQWERSLQVITDLLLTDGHPGVIPSDTGKLDREHIPIIACNRDLVFKAAADLPRFGHGAFLTCLEALYKVRKRKSFIRKYLQGIFFLV